MIIISKLYLLEIIFLIMSVVSNIFLKQIKIGYSIINTNQNVYRKKLIIR